MIPITLTEDAERDLRGIIAYLEERNPAAARRLSGAFDRTFDFLGRFPEIGWARDDLSRGLRCIVTEDYLVLYRIADDAVYINRIISGKQDIERMFRDRRE
jgi:toxin ParE1/3/4